jgi:hypothetical protein
MLLSEYNCRVFVYKNRVHRKAWSESVKGAEETIRLDIEKNTKPDIGIICVKARGKRKRRK